MPEDRTREGDGATRDERRAFSPSRDSGAPRCVDNMLVACRSPLDRPLPPGERPGGTAPRQVRGALSLWPAVFPAQPLGHLVEHRTFGWGQALQSLERDLVEHAVELGHLPLVWQ